MDPSLSYDLLRTGRYSTDISLEDVMELSASFVEVTHSLNATFFTMLEKDRRMKETKKKCDILHYAEEGPEHEENKEGNHSDFN